MSGESGDPAERLAGQLEAADSLIESLETEVASLRVDLERATVALKAAREEVAARERALKERQAGTADPGEEERPLQDELSRLRMESADEQLRLRNEHINDTAAMRREAITLGERLIAAEAELDASFATKVVDERSLAEKVARIGELQAALRTAHLKYHLSTKALLTPEQITSYAQLRGYAGGGSHHHRRRH